MITVELRDLVFTAFHGIHEEEKILGNEYIVNISLSLHEKEEVISHIHDTVNYAAIYEIIKRRMAVPTPLLETIVMETGNEIHAVFPELKSISVSIEKAHPPIESFQGSARVIWHKEF